MAVLSAVFKGIDEISNVFERMASSGARAVDQWETAGSTASDSFEEASKGADSAAKAMQQAASSTDNWTAAVGNYEKSALEANYTTEELVELGFKTEEALGEAAKAAREEADAMEKNLAVHNEFVATNAELEAELENLQDAYIGAAVQYGKNSEEARGLQKEIKELSKTLGDNKKEYDELAKAAGKSGETSGNAMEQLQQTLVAAGITKMINDITQAVIEMANQFSEAESVIVKATGATGKELDSLRNSMLNVYATVDDPSMENAAAAIGELNTRWGLTGKTLEDVTGVFMQYADNTNSDVVPAIQSVSKVMKNWNVDVNDTESLLDKFTYASQASGASVSALSDAVYSNKAMLDQMGYSLDESIALFSMFEAEGLNGSTIMMGFKSALSEFSAQGLDASAALSETIEKIAAMGNESEATALAIDVFGGRAGAQLADAIRTGRFEIEDWTAAIEKSNGTLARTDEAADTVADKWTQATNSMSAAVSKTLSPADNGVSVFLAGVVNGIGEFLNKHPAVTAALAGLAAGILTVVAGLAIYQIVTTIGTVVTAIFGTTLSVALWPITLIVAGIAALVAGMILLFNWLGNSNKEFNSLTATSKEHYEAVEELNTAYEKEVELSGENSEAAQKLAADLEAARAVYEANKMTLEEFVAQNDKLLESHQKVIDSYNESMESINNEDKSSSALIAKLGELSAKTTLTASEQQQMSAVVDKLNKQMPQLALAYDKETGALNRSVDAIRAMAQAQAEQQRMETQHQAYVDSLSEQADLEEQLAKATEQVAAAQQRVNDEVWKADGIGGVTKKQTKKDLEAFLEEQERLQTALNENLALQSETEASWEAIAAAQAEAAKAVVSYEDSVSRAIQSVSDDMNVLIEKYDEAYSSAKQNIDNTIGLFNTMKTETELSIKDMTGAMTSQMEFLELYSENLRKAAEYGLDDGLIASLSDGSAESAGQINALIAEIERLGGSTEGLSGDAAGFVDDFNKQFEGVQEAKEQFASQVADMQTGFSSGMDEIETRMTEAIDNMNMESDAAAAAKETIQAYIDQIKSMTNDAHSAAEGVALAAQSALGGTGVSTVGVPGYATGTTDAPNMFIAGENGPELIVGAGGSTVFPADATNDILSAAGRVPVSAEPSPGIERSENESGGGASEKRLTIDLVGSGEFSVKGDYDDETMWNMMSSGLKPLLLGLIRQEIFEEGDEAYAY